MTSVEFLPRERTRACRAAANSEGYPIRKSNPGISNSKSEPSRETKIRKSPETELSGGATATAGWSVGVAISSTRFFRDSLFDLAGLVLWTGALRVVVFIDQGDGVEIPREVGRGQ